MRFPLAGFIIIYGHSEWKLSGSVPSGVSARLAGGRLVVSGAPTAKGGAYEAVYQVSQIVGRKTEPGLTIRLAFAVTDVAALDPSAPGANPSVKARRTVPDMMVVDEAGQRLVGILSNLTIQPTGRCPAGPARDGRSGGERTRPRRDGRTGGDPRHDRRNDGEARSVGGEGDAGGLRVRDGRAVREP